MGLFSKKCWYCREKIGRGKEVKADVKVPGYVGTRSKNFCCKEHTQKYEDEVEEHLRNSKKSGGGCCG